MNNRISRLTRLAGRGWSVGFASASLSIAALAAGPAEVVPYDACLIASQNSVGFHRHDCDLVGCGKQAMLRARLAAQPDALSERPGLVSLAQDDGTASSLGITEAMGATDVTNVALDLEITPALNINITGTCTYTVRVLTNGTNQFTVRLRSQFNVTALTLNGANWPLANIAAPSSTTRVITLDRPYNANETFTLAIAYTGATVSRGFGSITFGTQNTVPIVSTLSEPYFAYTWWPAKDGDFGVPGDNSDKFSCQISITAPDPLRSVANGLLLGVDTLSGGRSRYRWGTTLPLATYLAFFSTTNYTNYQLTWNYNNIDGQSGSMPVHFWMYPTSDTPANRAQWELSVPALTLYSHLYGLYPFVNEKYGVYQFPFGGGMEHQTFTGMGSFVDYITVHELAHQWWGDNVTCKTWSDIWLSEGLADYSEALWYEQKDGGHNLAALKSAMAARRPGTGSDTVYVFDTSNANRIFQTSTTYYKGGWVMHMLRHVLGDAAYFNALRNYRAAYQLSAATTDDFRASFEGSTGVPLTQFMNQWVYGSGEVAYASGFDNITVNGRKYARFHIRQTQNAAYGSGSRFEMPVDVRLTQGASSSLAVVNNTQAAAQFYCVPVANTVTAIAIDPDDWILASAKTSEALLVGPPKVVQVVPDPGAAVPFESATQQVDVYFSAPVNTTGSHYTLTGPSGAVPVTLTYTAAAQCASLATASPLQPGTYTLTVSAAVVATTGGQALDGEVTNPASPAALPSGNGIAGGSATVTFTVSAPACNLDYNLDTSVNPDDLGDYITDYYTLQPIPGPGGYATPCPGNAPPYNNGYKANYTPDGSGQCNPPFPDNLGDFITAYFQGC